MKRRHAALLLLPLLTVVFALLVWPMGVLGYASLHAHAALTFSNYVQIFADEFFRQALLHSLVMSLLVSAAATSISTGPAWLLAQHEFRGKPFVRAAFTLPLSLSGIMVGFLAVVMLGRVGLVPKLVERWTGYDGMAGAAYQLSGMVVAYLYFEIPRGVLSLETAFRKFDRQLLVAAAAMGASPFQRLRWIILPLIWPALLSTFALTYSVSLGSFGVAMILSRRFSVLPLELFHQFTAMSNAPLASAMALTLAVVALLVQWSCGESTPRPAP